MLSPVPQPTGMPTGRPVASAAAGVTSPATSSGPSTAGSRSRRGRRRRQHVVAVGVSAAIEPAGAGGVAAVGHGRAAEPLGEEVVRQPHAPRRRARSRARSRRSHCPLGDRVGGDRDRADRARPPLRAAAPRRAPRRPRRCACRSRAWRGGAGDRPVEHARGRAAGRRPRSPRRRPRDPSRAARRRAPATSSRGRSRARRRRRRRRAPRARWRPPRRPPYPRRAPSWPASRSRRPRPAHPAIPATSLTRPRRALVCSTAHTNVRPRGGSREWTTTPTRRGPSTASCSASGPWATGPRPVRTCHARAPRARRVRPPPRPTWARRASASTTTTSCRGRDAAGARPHPAALPQALDETGLMVTMATTNLFCHPAFKDGAFTSNDPDVRRFAIRQDDARRSTSAPSSARSIYVFWGGREGVETDAAKPPCDALERYREAINFLCGTSRDQGYDMRFALEPKPNEPRGDLFLPTVGHALHFIETLEHPEMVGVNPEVAHETMAGLSFTHARGPGALGRQALPHRPQRASRSGATTRTSASARRTSGRLLPRAPARGHPATTARGTSTRTPTAPRTPTGVWDFAAGCMRTYLILSRGPRSSRASPADPPRRSPRPACPTSPSRRPARTTATTPAP